MKGTMKVCVLTGQRQLEWTEREIPQPAAGELQIKLAKPAELVIIIFALM